MTERGGPPAAEAASSSRRLAVLLAMAMFVLVVDTSLMNVSISAVVRDLDTTVSGVQSAIALEALVSAAFILIGGKVGDLFGRNLAYVLGLLGYAVGAVAMTLAQNLIAIIVFWALIGGLGASLLLPAMQSLIHGNFDGAARTKVYALVGAAAHRPRRRRALRARDGRHRAEHPGLAGGRRVRRRAHGGRPRRDGCPRLVAAAPQAPGPADPVGPGAVHVAFLPARGLPAAPPADRPRRHHDRAAPLPADGAGVRRVAGGAVDRTA